jgi:hypothetical protein
MTERKKAIKIPERGSQAQPPLIAVVGGDPDERDVSQPVGYDANGKPLYAPRGFIVRFWR